jgi:hypothetical protein
VALCDCEEFAVLVVVALGDAGVPLRTVVEVFVSGLLASSGVLVTLASAMGVCTVVVWEPSLDSELEP